MLKKYLILIFVGLQLSALAQDPEFTQFYANPLYLNPAFAGSAKCPRLSLNFRDQWPSLKGNFVNYSASYDQHFDGFGGVGLLFLNDKAGEGTLTTTNISAIYSYQLNVSREFSIRAGFQGTYVQKSIDWDKLTFGDMIDPRYGFIYSTQEVRPGETSKSFVDISAGLLFYTTKFYGGVAVNHLTEPEESFIRPVEGSTLPMKITAHAGALLPLGSGRDEDTYISPNILYQKQRDFEQLNIGVYISKSPIVGGLWYRVGDAFIAMIGLQYGMYKFGYSYDLTTSKLSDASAGSHEFSLGIQFPCKPKKKRFRTIKCPSF